MRIRPALLAASAVVLLAVLLGAWLLVRPVDPAGGSLPAPITVSGQPSTAAPPAQSPPATAPATPGPGPGPVPSDVVPPPPVDDDDDDDDDGPDDDGPDDDLDD